MNYDDPIHPLHFILKVSIGVIGGLILGALIDTSCRKLQNETEPNRYKAILFFIIQIFINIILLLILSCVFQNQFIKWFQLTISGALFAVLLFAVQTNLINNSLRISKF